MNRKGLAPGIASYTLWGLLPVYWALLGKLDSMFILANRILFSSIFTLILLAVNRKIPELRTVLHDKKLMKLLIPAAVCITLQWGVYIFAVNNGHIMQASLGYYMNPLISFLLGVLLFREHSGKPEVAAILLAAAGVLIVTVQSGSFPYIPIILAVFFAAYGCLKKIAKVDSLTGIAVETLSMAPIALLYLAISPQSHAAYSMLNIWDMLLLAGSGVVTAIPLILYARGVNELPFITMGFLQYICPTLMLIIGIIRGEPFTALQAVSFGFIWAGILIFSISTVLRHKKETGLAEGEV